MKPALALAPGALLVLLACAPQPGPSGAGTANRRAIFVSFDAMNEERVRTTVAPDAIPNLLRFFDEASCADGARPMWPSVTAASHAALWTGVYGNVNGVVANAQVPLPWSEFSLTELRSGFEPRELRAEPIWITAARAGRSVVGHHVTQAGEPGRWRPGGGRDTALVRRDSAALADLRLLLLNGYAGGPEPRLLTAERNPAKPATAWRQIERLGPVGVPLREVSWAIGPDSLHALFFGPDQYREVIVSAAREVGRGVRVRPVSVERAPAEGRDLARYFSEVLWLPEPGGRRSGVYFRLWTLAPDLSTYQLFQSGRATIRTNHPEALAVYETAVGGFVGNTAWGLLQELGPTLERGGDGTTELKFLETAELETRQFIRGSAWVWRHRRPNLLLDYFSLADDLDHSWLGLVSPEVPGHDPLVAVRINAMRSRGWALVDRRLAALRALARESNALLLVGGDHGMRATWRFFHVNTVLRQAGLLAADGSGRPDLSRTRAISSNGYYVNVNRVERKGGIVPPDRADRVADSVIQVLRAARGPDGAPVVTGIWRPEPEDTMGVGGPSGGDVYFGLAPGYYYSSALKDSVSTTRAPAGSHGFPSIERDMHTVLCAIGPGVGGRRLSTARIIDGAPTVSAWLGIPAPADARGVSLLEVMKARLDQLRFPKVER